MRMKANRVRAAGLLAWIVACLLLMPIGVSAQESVAHISSPQPGAPVREVVVVTGSAIHPRFSFYKVEYAVEPGSNWVVIDTYPNQVRDVGAVGHPGVPDGSYSLRLSVVDGQRIGTSSDRSWYNAGPRDGTPTVTGTPPEVLTATAEGGRRPRPHRRLPRPPW